MTDHPNAAAPAPAAAAAAAPPVPALPPLPVIPPEILKTTRLYELMLLFEPAEAQRTWEKLVDWAKGIVQERHGGFIMKVDQWAESRKLAYEVKGVRRGTYLIIYYRGKPTKQVDLERDFRLDEKVMRHMLIAHDKDPDSLTGRVRERVADDFDDDDYRRRDDYGFDDDEYDRDDY